MIIREPAHMIFIIELSLRFMCIDIVNILAEITLNHSSYIRRTVLLHVITRISNEQVWSGT